MKMMGGAKGGRGMMGKLGQMMGLGGGMPMPSPEEIEAMQKQMGGADNTSKFARLFLAPGVGHCGGGPGPQPDGQFDAVVRWVEEGKAPEALNAVRRGPNGVTRTRPLCQFPMVARYKGTGSTDDAANFACAAR